MGVGCTVHQLQSFRRPQIFQIDYQFCTVGFFTLYITVRGRQSPEKLIELFSIRRNYGCVGGGVRFPRVGSPSWRHFPRAWDPLVYFVGTWWGFFDSANLKTNKDTFGVCFLFPPLCSLQTSSASPATQIWYGAFGTGLSGARYVSVTLFF